MNRKPFPWRMGADPEFTVLLNNKRCAAKAVFSHFKDVEAKTTNMGFRLDSMKGDIGWDGCNETAEIRPDAANTADELVANIGSLLIPTLGKLPAFDFSTLSLFAPIGGHLHFDLPNEGIDSDHLLRLEKQLVSFYLPVMLSENAVSQAIRLKSYGKLNDFHTDRTFMVAGKEIHTLEFRAPSAEWLTTPKVALAITAYLSVIWHECRNNPTNVTKWKDIAIKTEKQMDALQTLATSNFTALTAMLMTQIHRAIRTFEFYPVYKREIEWLFNPKNVLKEKERVGYDLARGWGIKKNDSITKEQFLTKKKLVAANKENGLSLDFCASNIMIPFNDDANVKPFATALSERIAAYGWKPKYDYYFYGLKKSSGSVLIANDKKEIALNSNIFATEEEKESAQSAINRMNSRGKERFDSRNGIIINSKTGRIEKSDKQLITIGLPQDTRSNLRVKEVLEAIWKVETEKAAFKPLEVKNSQKAQDHIETVNREDTEDVIDSSSQGARLANEAIRDLTQENQGGGILPTTDPAITTEDWKTRIMTTRPYVRFTSNIGDGFGWSIAPIEPHGDLILIDTVRSPSTTRGWNTNRGHLPTSDRLTLGIPLDTSGLLYSSDNTPTTCAE